VVGFVGFLAKPREGPRFFGDLLGKLTIVRDKCNRRGRYSVKRLIEQHGRTPR
jgi:hypothetical protein